MWVLSYNQRKIKIYLNFEGWRTYTDFDPNKISLEILKLIYFFNEYPAWVKNMENSF